MKPSNSGRNSPVRQKFSGCHCTATRKTSPACSMASMTPSGAVPVTSHPGATSYRLMMAAVHLALSPSSFSPSFASRDLGDPHLVGDGITRLGHRVVARRR